MAPTGKQKWMMRRRAGRHGLRKLSPKLLRIGERQDWLCPPCGRSLFDGRPINKDHIRPLSKGGYRHDEANIQLTHVKCNLRKGDAWPESKEIAI